MLSKLLPLALLPILAFTQPAEARQLFWWQMVNPDGTAVSPDVYTDTYAPQDYYGDTPDYYPPDAMTSQEQFDQRQYEIYRREMARRYHRRAYYQDPAQANGDPSLPYAAPVYPVKHIKKHVKKLVQQKPVVHKPNAITSTSPGVPPVMPSGPIAAAVAATPAPAPLKPSSGSGINCAKGATIVSSFGFSNVTSKSCVGSTLVYGAERSGKNFEINVSAASGEVTAVKKL